MPASSAASGRRQRLRAVPEVRLRRGLDAVRAVRQVDRVQVRRQDPCLRPVARAGLELPRERGLLQLARDRALVVDERVLDELLRDCRAALNRALVPDVGPDGAHDPVQVDAVVLVEAMVLDVDDRVLHPRRDVVPVDELARLRPAQHGEDRLSVVRVDVAVDLAGLRALRVEVRQLSRDSGDQSDRERRPGEQKEDQQERKKTKLANPARPFCAFPEQHGTLIVVPLRALRVQQDLPVRGIGARLALERHGDD